MRPLKKIMSESDHTPIFEAPELDEVIALFPSYDIHQLVACGGMGAVYQATQRALDRSVAIKILPREFSTDEAFRTGFEAEAKAMAKLNHPNLIGVYDFGEAGGMLFIVMEYVAGSSLYQAAQGQPVEQSEVVRLVAGVCRGLANAHEHGILHRDIKPANILLDMQLNPKIGDFGLARASEKQIEEGEQIFGTPGYTAPEVVEPPFTIDHRADIFSVGVMLHELLTAKLPDSDPRPASHIVGSNPRLDAVIQKAMHNDPAKRYNSAIELAEEIEAIQKSPAKALMTSASAAASGRKYVAPKMAKKSSSGMGFMLLLLAIAGAAGYYWFVMRPSLDTKDESGQEMISEIVDAAEMGSESDVKAKTPPRGGGVPLMFEDAMVDEAEESTVAEEPSGAEEMLEETATNEKPEDSEPGPEPKFDVEGFFKKADGIMEERILPITEQYKADKELNTNAFVREAMALIEGDEEGESRGMQLAVLERSSSRWEENNFTLPAKISKKLLKDAGIADLHEGYLSKQNSLDSALLEAISKEKGTYIFGLENQIKRLAGTDDPGAVKMLQDEIETTQKDEDHFTSKFVGDVIPDADSAADEDDE